METWHRTIIMTFSLIVGSCLLTQAHARYPQTGAVIEKILPVRSGVLAAGQRPLDLNFIIDHTTVDASVIPQDALDATRQLAIYFNHRSIGSNILQGMADLAAQNPTRYSMRIVSGYGTDQGINHYTAGENGDPLGKVSGFSSLVQDGHDTAFMKFCVGDFPPWTSISATDIWTAYREAMEDLVAEHPDTVLVWWTNPLTSPSDGRGLEHFATYNALVRQYVARHGGILFDIADIQSHDPNGNPITSGGYEAMYESYSTDGAHLSAAGRQRLAQALWWLLARIAGWPGESASISVIAITDAASIYPGQTATYTLSVTASPGFHQPVALALQHSLSGATVSFSPNPVTPPGTSLLSVATAALTEIGTYALVAVGTAGQERDSTPLTLTINPTLTLRADPAVRAVPSGDTATYTLSVGASQGFDDPVTLALQGAPPGAGISINPNPVSLPGASQLQIATAASTPPGTYSMQVTGVSGAISKATHLDLVATSTASFTLAVSPTVHLARPNQAVSCTAAINGMDGFSQPVTLEVVGLAAGVGKAWSSNPVTPGNASILTLSIPNKPPFGHHLFYVVGTFGTQVVAECVELTIDYPYKIYLPLTLK